MLQIVISAGPTTPVMAAGKHGASAVTVLPNVRLATLFGKGRESFSLMLPEVVLLAVKLPTAFPLIALSSTMPVTAVTPRLLPVITPVDICVTEPVVVVKRTVLAAPAVSA